MVAVCIGDQVGIVTRACNAPATLMLRVSIGLSPGGTGHQYRREIGKFLDHDKSFDRKLAGQGWSGSRLCSCGEKWSVDSQALTPLNSELCSRLYSRRTCVFISIQHTYYEWEPASM